MSKNISLYGLGQEFKALENLANDIEIDEETGEFINNDEVLNGLFQELELSLIDKLDGCEYIRKELISNVSTLADEIKRLQQRKKAYENKAERLKELMKETVLTSGETKLKGKHNFSLGIRRTLQIDENLTADFINQDYVRTKKEFDKKKITDDLKSGLTIPGAKMVDKISLSVR